MGYSTGLLRKRVHILNRDTDATGAFGKNSAGRGYTYACTVWADVTFTKGVKAMHEGAFDAYDRLMVRMRYTDNIDRQSAIIYDGRTFQIKSFNVDRHLNQIQLTVVEWAGKDLTGELPSED